MAWAAELGAMRRAYDYILIDRSPSLSFITTAVLWAADVIVVPVVLDPDAEICVTRFLHYIRETKRAGGAAVGRPVWILPRRLSIDGDDRIMVPAEGHGARSR
jgi:cellulose biosynthesis protein BcsQ